MNASTPFTHHTIAIQQVEQILLGARARGLDIDPLLQRAGIPAVLLKAPLSRVTQAQYAALTFVLRHTLEAQVWRLADWPRAEPLLAA